ncbi:hypothetical protein MTP99_005049 [Tenebrio molitor]|nr:hypothetical protein MTP99_005049 [Tenebrio molitor]
MNQYSWALQMVDATSKIPSGLWSLNFGEMGDFEQCINVAATTRVGAILGKYCLGYLVVKNTSSSFHREMWEIISLDKFGTDQALLSAKLLWALCLPDGCTTDDANLVGDFLLTNVIGNEVSVRFSDLLCQTVKEVNPPLTNGAIVTIAILSMLSATIVFATLYDMFCIFKGHKSRPILVKGFSVYTNSMKLFKITTPMPDQLPCLNGLKFLSMFQYISILFAQISQINRTACNRCTDERYSFEDMGSGPKWPLIDKKFQQPCANYWWSALLYVQNYVNVNDMCIRESWYLNVDFQLYLISPVLLYPLWKYPRVCLSFLVLCILGFVGVSFYVAWVYNLTVIPTNFYGNMTITKITTTFLRIQDVHHGSSESSWGTMLACSLGGYRTLRNKGYDKWGNAIHIALVRPVWSLAISWVILACTNDYGGLINWVLSLPIYQILNRFTYSYSIYLTHLTILHIAIYGKKRPDYFNNFNMAYQFWGILWFSAGISYLLVLMIESSIVVMEKMLLESFGKRKQWKRYVFNGVDNAAIRK